MTFNIRRKIFDDGELDEGAAEELMAELCDRFSESPECKYLVAEGIVPGWCQAMLDYAIRYCRVGPADMAASDLRQVIFCYFPRKVSCSPKEAPEIVEEFTAFWRFLKREFHLQNADECLAVLAEPGAVARLEKELASTANYGVAKSFVMGTVWSLFTLAKSFFAWVMGYGRPPGGNSDEHEAVRDTGLLTAERGVPAALRNQAAEERKARRKRKKREKTARKQSRTR